MSNKLSAVIAPLVFSSLFISPNVLAQTPKALTYSQDRLIVKLKNADMSLQAESITSVKHLFMNNYVVYSSDIKNLYNDLKNNINVSEVNYDYHAGKREIEAPVAFEKLAKNLKEIGALFNDPGMSKLWAFKSASNNGMAVEDYYRNLGDTQLEDVVVAVVDTGVDYNHEDLKEIMWTNEGEIAGNGIDDDGNGYIDDVYGINTLVRDSEGRATGDVMDKHSHGTHVSGTIAAKHNNGIGVAGISNHAKIMAIRTVPNNGDETDVDVAESFIYAAKNGAKVINCSFGKSHNEGGNLVKETIDFIGREYGVLVVAAAGNESSNIDRTLVYPASYESENLLVVSASTSSGGLAYFSNYGIKNSDVVAPGSSIYSTTPGNRYSNMSGTSMASPNTAGVAAQILAMNPQLTPYELKAKIIETVTPVSKYSSKVVAGGLVNLSNSL